MTTLPDAPGRDTQPDAAAPSPSERPGAAPALFAAVAAGSFAGVYLQVSLMKLTAVMFYSIFVYAIIGVALLGYGAAGSLLAARSRPSRTHPARHLARTLVAFAAVVVPAFLAVNAINLPAQQVFGSLRGLPVLLLTYSLLTVPFLFLGLGIAGTFAAYAADVNRLYFADLVGAGAGSAAAAGRSSDRSQGQYRCRGRAPHRGVAPLSARSELGGCGGSQAPARGGRGRARKDGPA